MPSYSNPFTEKTIMSFGPYRSKPLGDIPASYLLELYSKIVRYAPNKRSLVEAYLIDYIETNKSQLENKK